MYRDITDDMLKEFKKFDTGEQRDLPDLPFELYVNKEKPKKQKLKIKVPGWLSYVFVYRTFLYSFINEDSLSKLTDFFTSKSGDPKLVKSIFKELKKLDRK